jgi:hypothetical protein
MTKVSCQKVIELLPDSCPVRLACDSTMKEICQNMSVESDEQCELKYCTCEIKDGWGENHER